ncbi:MAG: AzlC family ABC transporter permease [Actinomycetota bacterium]
MKQRGMLAATATPAAAIFVFGVIYGSLSRPQMGAGATILSSLLIFSGALQFTITALLSAGAGVGALVAGAITLNLRNLVLGAVLRPRVDKGPLKRAGLAWFLVDESAGLALAAGGDAGRTLLVSGVAFYSAWQAGTVLGLLGASVESVSSAAEAVFPVLFIGLAALSCQSRSIAARAVVAAGLTAGAAVLWPGGRGLAAVIAAVAVAIPGHDR